MVDVTEYSDINAFLRDILSNLQTILDKKLMGVYLFGSLVWGDFEYESSDIDLLVATKEGITQDEFNKLDLMQKELWTKYKHGQEGMVEVVYASLDTLQTFKTKSSDIAVVSPGEYFNIKSAGKDWLINWYLVREKGKTLFGPDPKTIILPISKEEFKQSIKEQAQHWREEIIVTKNSRPYQAYAILTLCRALYAFRNGEQVSKKRAALWTAEKLPEYSFLIENAIKWRKDWRHMDIDHTTTYAKTKEFVDFVIDQISNT